ncbi:MAG: hypothetical protein V4507_03720 [Verrucomicrobiota bacterium]
MILRYIFAFLFILAGFGSVGAQQLIETDPILASVFPLEEKSNSVVLTQTILLNKEIVPAGSILRVLYVMPQLGDNEVRSEVIKKQQESAYSRAPEIQQKVDSPIVVAAKKLALGTRWTSAQLFRLKLANQNTPDLKLVYQETAEGELREAPLNFLHGLFLGEKAGKVVVIAVERKTSAASANFVAGDAILQIGSQKLDGTLAQFLKVYQEEKSKAEATSSRDFAFQVLPAKQEVPVTKTFKLALSLKSNLLDY